MKNPFSSIDWSKITANTLSGFIVSIALLFAVDAYMPNHIVENIFTETTAGILVVVGISVIIGSSILGLMMDSIFQTFGRYFARKFWRPLRYEFIYRIYCMHDVGLIVRDFEWIYANSKDRMSADVEKDYMRFTAVAGSSAYAMLLLLSPATFLFLRLEYKQPDWLSLFVAGIIDIGAIILLLTSAESLSKYEKKKTAAAMDDIRKLSSHFSSSTIRKEDSRQKKAHWWSQKKDHWWSLKLLWLLLLIAPAGLLLWSSHIAAAHKLMEEKQMTSMVIISDLINKTDIPNINITVSKNNLATPGDQTASMIVVLNEWLREPTSIQLKNTNLVDLVHLLSPPKWKLIVSLYNTYNVAKGDRIYINTFLSFDGPPPEEDPLHTKEYPLRTERISAGEIEEGNWVFPIIVTADKKDYLLAEVHVQITAAPSSASGANSAGGQPSPKSQ